MPDCPVPRSARLRIAIVGCGIAGAALAARLGRRGHAVEVFERGTGSAGGAGLLLAPPALALLRDLGLEDEARALGAVVFGLRAMRARGAPLLDWDARRCGAGYLGFGIGRRVLHELLARAARTNAAMHHGLDIDSVDSESGGIVDTRGTHWGPYDLVVASDGAGSRLRAGQPTLVTRMHRYAWTAFSCLMRDPADTPVRTTMNQWFRGAHHASIWPVGAAASGEQVVCVSINVPAASAPQLSTPDHGVCELRRLGLEQGAALRSLQAASPWVALSCRDVALRRLFHGRLVFVGDAAHSLSPQLGQGARLALAGAANLDIALDSHPVAEALAEYDRSQRALAARYQRWSRWLTPLFQSQRHIVQWLRDGVVGPLSRLPPVERALIRLLCDTPGQTEHRCP